MPESGTTDEPEPNGTGTPQAEGLPDESPKGDTPPSDAPPSQDWEARARRWERDAKKAQARLTQLEQRAKSLIEPETVADKDRALADTQAELARAQNEVLKFRVAAEAGLPLDMAPRLIGDDEDALREDAKALATTLNPKPRRTDAARGTSDDGAPARRDPNALLRQIVGGV